MDVCIDEKRRYDMAVSYNRLFKMLIDRKMMKKELCELADVSPSTISKNGQGRNSFHGSHCKNLSHIELYSG